MHVYYNKTWMLHSIVSLSATEQETYVGPVPTYAAVPLTFDRSSCKLAHRLLLPRGKFTPIWFLCAFSVSNEGPVRDGRTDRRTGKTHNAAYWDGRITTVTWPIGGTREREWHRNCCLPVRKDDERQDENNEKLTDVNKTLQTTNRKAHGEIMRMRAQSIALQLPSLAV